MNTLYNTIQKNQLLSKKNLYLRDNCPIAHQDPYNPQGKRSEGYVELNPQLPLQFKENLNSAIRSLNLTQRKVLSVGMSYSRASEEFVLGQYQWALMVGITRRHLQRILVDLEKWGWIASRYCYKRESVYKIAQELFAFRIRSEYFSFADNRPSTVFAYGTASDVQLQEIAHKKNINLLQSEYVALSKRSKLFITSSSKTAECKSKVYLENITLECLSIACTRARGACDAGCNNLPHNTASFYDQTELSAPDFALSHQTAAAQKEKTIEEKIAEKRELLKQQAEMLKVQLASGTYKAPVQEFVAFGLMDPVFKRVDFDYGQQKELSTYSDKVLEKVASKLKEFENFGVSIAHRADWSLRLARMHSEFRQ